MLAPSPSSGSDARRRDGGDERLTPAMKQEPDKRMDVKREHRAAQIKDIIGTYEHTLKGRNIDPQNVLTFLKTLNPPQVSKVTEFLANTRSTMGAGSGIAFEVVIHLLGRCVAMINLSLFLCCLVSIFCLRRASFLLTGKSDGSCPCLWPNSHALCFERVVRCVSISGTTCPSLAK